MLPQAAGNVVFLLVRNKPSLISAGFLFMCRAQSDVYPKSDVLAVLQWSDCNTHWLFWILIIHSTHKIISHKLCDDDMCWDLSSYEHLLFLSALCFPYFACDDKIMKLSNNSGKYKSNFKQDHRGANTYREEPN